MAAATSSNKQQARGAGPVTVEVGGVVAKDTGLDTTKFHKAKVRDRQAGREREGGQVGEAGGDSSRHGNEKKGSSTALGPSSSA